MSLPVSALNDDELMHYASVDHGAAIELSRRIAEGNIDPGAERKELLEEVRRLESQAGDAEDELECLRSEVREACLLMHRAIDPQERDLSPAEIINKALGLLE